MSNNVLFPNQTNLDSLYEYYLPKDQNHVVYPRSNEDVTNSVCFGYLIDFNQTPHQGNVNTSNILTLENYLHIFNMSLEKNPTSLQKEKILKMISDTITNCEESNASKQVSFVLGNAYFLKASLEDFKTDDIHKAISYYEKSESAYLQTAVAYSCKKNVSETDLRTIFGNFKRVNNISYRFVEEYFAIVTATIRKHISKLNNISVLKDCFEILCHARLLYPHKYESLFVNFGKDYIRQLLVAHEMKQAVAVYHIVNSTGEPNAKSSLHQLHAEMYKQDRLFFKEENIKKPLELSFEAYKSTKYTLVDYLKSKDINLLYKAAEQCFTYFETSVSHRNFELDVDIMESLYEVFANFTTKDELCKQILQTILAYSQVCLQSIIASKKKFEHFKVRIPELKVPQTSLHIVSKLFTVYHRALCAFSDHFCQDAFLQQNLFKIFVTSAEAHNFDNPSALFEACYIICDLQCIDKEYWKEKQDKYRKELEQNESEEYYEEYYEK